MRSYARGEGVSGGEEALEEVESEGEEAAMVRNDDTGVDVEGEVERAKGIGATRDKGKDSDSYSSRRWRTPREFSSVHPVSLTE